MTALDRFDDWAGALDDVLEPDSLAAVYDRTTLRAIETGSGEPSSPPRPAGRWRGGAAAGAMVVSLVQGVRDVLDDDEEADPVVEIDEELRHRRLEPVSVHLAWGNPAASVAIVRHWLI